MNRKQPPVALMMEAIVEDDRAKVSGLLGADRSLATLRIGKAKLYQDKILHWIYAGDTLLHLAAAGYRLEIMRQLIKAGADPNAKGRLRWATPLHYASDGYINSGAYDAQTQVKAIALLLEAGADINAQDKNGATPLHRAVRTRCAAAVEYLLRAGADPLARNKPGSTPFHLAVQNTGRGGSGAAVAIAAQRQIIEKLLLFGLSPELKSANGKTVRDSAQSVWIQEALAGR